ncbi:hypothetical protein IE4872_PD02076 (plasmid) [Rhizobium gallicum]|uniref:Uncharacterized protein n=1 Tax=Rhizobium gallicum TaxID=56730 RepID=A0A1L5NXJ5_9HYPH|nr:hypothetical protein IE4872_PD02076 [Rhizobium gallicum]
MNSVPIKAGVIQSRQDMASEQIRLEAGDMAEGRLRPRTDSPHRFHEIGYYESYALQRANLFEPD